MEGTGTPVTHSHLFTWEECLAVTVLAGPLSSLFHYLGPASGAKVESVNCIYIHMKGFCS